MSTTASRGSTRTGSSVGLVEWFRAASRARNAYGLLAFAAVGYSIGVALPLAIAGALPMPDPFLRIANADYFYWGIYFYAPVILVAWLLASAAMFLLGWAFGRRPEFGEMLRLSAFATGLGTLGTLLSDLVTSPMRATGLINEQAWEQSVLNHDGWFWFLYFWMAVYLVMFCVGYPVAARLATRLPWSRSIVTGIVGFLVFQGFEFIFIR